MNKHVWGKNGCKCHVYCSKCGAQFRVADRGDAPRCTDDRRAAWSEKLAEIDRQHETHFALQSQIAAEINSSWSENEPIAEKEITE